MLIRERKRCWHEARADPPDSNQPGITTGGVVEHSRSFRYAGKMSNLKKAAVVLLHHLQALEAACSNVVLPNRLSPGGHGGVRGGGIAGGGKGSNPTPGPCMVNWPRPNEIFRKNSLTNCRCELVQVEDGKLCQFPIGRQIN